MENLLNSIETNDTFLTAIKNSNLELVRQILLSSKSGSLVNCCDWSGHTPLHLTAINGDIETAMTLIRLGADVNLCSKLNKTPLHFACQYGHVECVKLLISNGSNINSQDVLRMTPLHWSVEKNNIEITQILCAEKEININLLDKFNRSCLHLAITNKNEEIVKYLTEKMEEHKNMQKNFHLIEENLEKSSIRTFKSNRTTRIAEHLQLNEEEEKKLGEFYKKKSFAKCLSSKSPRILINAQTIHDKIQTQEQPILDSIMHLQSQSSLNNNANTNSSNHQLLKTNTNFIKQKKTLKDFELLIEDSDDELTTSSQNNKNNDSSDDDLITNDSSKKKRLSFSPISNIEDTLFWIKNQSNSSNHLFENKELSLTEAGKLTLDYLNANDPIRSEKRLFMRLVKTIEDQEKGCSSSSKTKDDDASTISLSSSYNSEINFDIEKLCNSIEIKNESKNSNDLNGLIEAEDLLDFSSYFNK